MEPERLRMSLLTMVRAGVVDYGQKNLHSDSIIKQIMQWMSLYQSQRCDLPKYNYKIPYSVFSIQPKMVLS